MDENLKAALQAALDASVEIGWRQGLLAADWPCPVDVVEAQKLQAEKLEAFEALLKTALSSAAFKGEIIP
ncbi:MAG: hypothetical protein WC291_02625 [Thermodesulfovibrionales bacterium]|jgi:hypothetical protein